MEVRALVFDVFGTLVDWRSGIAGAFAGAGAEGDPGRLADEWRLRFLMATQEVVRRERDWADVDDLHRETGPPELVDAWHRLDPWPDVPSGLDALRERRIVATLSNGHLAMLIDMARHAGLRFDALLSAEMAQTYKTDSAVYALAPRYLRLAPEEIMLVAAHPIDLAGARAAGLRTAYVDRPLEYGEGSPAREDPDADLSVGDLHALAAAL